MQHIVVIGKTGQLARALAARASNHSVKVSCFGREDCDLAADTNTLRNFAENLPACKGVIIAAAYTAVDDAETNRQAADKVNSIAPGVIADICRKRNIPLVHISTDYVFPGTGNRPLRPTDETDPINAYGASKRAGENAVIQSGARAAILRTSWVFDGTGKNFMTTMLRLAQSRDQLSVVADQIGRPTYAGHLADASFVAIKKLISTPDFSGGLYHVSGSGVAVSWAEFADAIFAAAISHIPHTMKVAYIPASQYPTPAKRPSYSVLDISDFETQFQFPMPNWIDGLKEAVENWKKSSCF